jgi:hypothetical protein
MRGFFFPFLIPFFLLFYCLFFEQNTTIGALHVLPHFFIAHEWYGSRRPPLTLFDTVLLRPHLAIVENELKLTMRFRRGEHVRENTKIVFPDPGGLYLPSKLSMM